MATKSVRNFSWAVGHPLPKIEPHTDRKLEVIEAYLKVYFDTVLQDPRVDNLNITLVDGFSGGGRYDKEGTVRDGSPFAALNSVFDAAIRLNQGKEKPVTISAAYHFGDDCFEHINFLRHEIINSQYANLLGKSLHLHHMKFTDLLPLVLADIKRRQRQGRSIFVLDQFGYADVPMESIRNIFDELPRAEIILTFSIDALLNYLHGESYAQPVVAQFGVTESFVRDWQAAKGQGFIGRAMSQRALMNQMARFSGAQFFTPFMIFSSSDNRNMMIAHLSQSQTARDKMLSVHWKFKNTFRHIGKGSLFELGFDANTLDSNTLFSFSEQDKSIMRRELEAELPKTIHGIVGDNEIAFGKLLLAIGNKTAATNVDMAETLRVLSDAKEIEVFDSSGKLRRAGSAMKPNDVLRLSTQMKFFTFDSQPPKKRK